MDGRVKRKTFADLMAEAALQGMPEDKTTADLLNVPLSRGAILPLTEYLDRAEFDLSSGLPGAFADAVTAPARAARGEISEDQQIPEAFNFAGSLTLGSLLAPRPTGGVGMGGRAANAKTGAAVPLATRALEAQQPQGIRAFHGSPHDFDRFSMEHIGTGEGAQAYGHGLYFAENEGVAKAYREALSDKTDALTPVTFEGRKIGPSAPGISGEDLAARFAAQSGGNARLARAHIRGMYNDPNNLPPAHKEAMRLLTEQPERFASAKYLEPGHMYEVNIKADPESFIDYDRPLGQQSEAVRRALDEAGLMPYTVVDQAGNRLDFSRGMPKAEAERFAAAKGGRAIPKDDADFDSVRKAQMMTGRGDAAQADIATALREAGIPGVRYLDQMSRGAGEGSSNYVVFDDAIIDIVKKYGIAGLALLQAAGYGTNEGEETQ